MKQVFLVLTLCSIATAQTFQAVVQKLEQSPVEQRRRIIEQYLNTKQFSPIIENDSVLHIVLYGLADSVFVNGNLQRWLAPDRLERIPCGTYSFFYRTYIVPSDARLDYQLIINGVTKLDPQNPLISPSGFGPHSEIRMPKFITSPYLAFRNDIPHGVIDSLAPLMKIPSPLNHYLPSPRAIKVYRPAGYDTLANLASVYFHDGFDAVDFALAGTFIDNLIDEKKIEPLIAVFIPSVQRQDEYIGNKLEQFVRYVADDIVPMIDILYKTEPSPLKRAVMGISNGGHVSLYMALRRPDVFLNAGGQSSTITPWLVDLTKKQYDAHRIDPQLKLYLDCGRYDIIGEDPWFGKFEFLELNRNYSNVLSSFHIPHYFKEVNDGHEWGNWRQRMPDMLIYFFGKHL
ncbi:MAG: alpha/beta hydrolase-fold protein [Bacteroidota bacterium]